jgi:hypothetical protein
MAFNFYLEYTANSIKVVSESQNLRPSTRKREKRNGHVYYYELFMHAC